MRFFFQNTRIAQFFFFVAVGGSAALTHWLVAVFASEVLHFKPLIANCIGWLVAFTISFAGHYRLTFAHQKKNLWQSCRRFFIVSLNGFVLNEISLAILLRYSTWQFQWLLLLILIGVALITFILSKIWAFK